MNRNEENMDELLSKFFDEQQVSQIERDIRLGDEILKLHPAPEPDCVTIEQVKANIQTSLARDKRGMWLISRKVAVAAMIIGLAFASMRFISLETQPDIAPGSWAHIWQDSETQSDLQLASLTAEIEEIANSLLSIRLDEQNGENEAYLDQLQNDLESELVQTNGDFWKG